MIELPSSSMQRSPSASPSLASTAPISIEAPAPEPAPIEASTSGGWAAVVRRGRPAPKPSAAEIQNTNTIQSSPTIGSSKIAWEPPTPESPIDVKRGRDKKDEISPTRSRKGGRGGSAAGNASAQKELAKQQCKVLLLVTKRANVDISYTGSES